MPIITVQPHQVLERILTIEIVRVTERAAVSAARLRGRGAEKASDQAAVDAMRRELNKLPIDGTVVIGEGELDEAPMLFIGEQVGTKHGPKVDIAVDPLEGTTLCAKNMPGAIATIAIAEGGTLLNAPDVYMEKIGIGPGYPKGVVALDAPAEENIRNLAKAKGVKPEEITALILDRPRHAELIAGVRKAGASVQLITDGDVAGVIHTADPASTGMDIYLGVGGAPEGVLAAAALRCIGGQMECRLVLDTDERRERAKKMGIKDTAQDLLDRGHGEGRLPVRRDRRHHRRDAQGRAVRAQPDPHPDGGDAFGDRHRALYRSRASPAREIPSGLSDDRPCGARHRVGDRAWDSPRRRLRRAMTAAAIRRPT